MNKDFQLTDTFNPELLVWARVNEGMSLAEAAERLGITEEQLLRYELGPRRATVIHQTVTYGELPMWSFVQKAAKVYRRPSAIFWREKTPKDPRRRTVRIVAHYSDGTEEVFWEEAPEQA